MSSVRRPNGSPPLTPVEMQLADAASTDAFSRLRVSQPVGLFAHAHEYSIDSTFSWEHALTGGGTATHLPNESAVRLRCATGATDQVVKQTRQYHRYQPGKSQLALMTFVAGAPAANVEKRIGYFDGQNGIFLKQDGDGLYIVRRSYTSGAMVDTEVAQADWSQDRFDGTGESGFVLDPTKSQILVIDLQWLGVGRVRVGFDIDGVVVWAHHFLNANNLATVYMTTANLPFRFEIKNTAAQAGNHDLIAICCSLSSEGGFELEHGFPFAVGGSTVAGTNVLTRRAVLSVRPKATFLGKTTRGRILPVAFDIFGQANPAYFEVVYNATFTGTPVWTSVDAESMVEYSLHTDVAAGAFTGGIVTQAGYIPISGTGSNTRSGVRGGTSELFLKLPLTLDIAGANPRAMSIVGTTMVSPGSTIMWAAANWLEFR